MIEGTGNTLKDLEQAAKVDNQVLVMVDNSVLLKLIRAVRAAASFYDAEHQSGCIAYYKPNSGCDCGLVELQEALDEVEP